MAEWNTGLKDKDKKPEAPEGPAAPKKPEPSHKARAGEDPYIENSDIEDEKERIAGRKRGFGLHPDKMQEQKRYSNCDFPK